MREEVGERTCMECGHCESQQGRRGVCLQNVDNGEDGIDCGCVCFYGDDEDETEAAS